MAEAGSFACPSCSVEIGVEAVLGDLRSYSPGTRSFASSCPSCGQGIELQVRSGRLVVGTTYWAGSFHFEGLLEVSARGIRAEASSDPPSIVYRGDRYPTSRP